MKAQSVFRHVSPPHGQEPHLIQHEHQPRCQWNPATTLFREVGTGQQFGKSFKIVPSAEI
jgi:hypothetical protein